MNLNELLPKFASHGKSVSIKFQDLVMDTRNYPFHIFVDNIDILEKIIGFNEQIDAELTELAIGRGSFQLHILKDKNYEILSNYYTSADILSNSYYSSFGIQKSEENNEYFESLAISSITLEKNKNALSIKSYSTPNKELTSTKGIIQKDLRQIESETKKSIDYFFGVFNLDYKDNQLICYLLEGTPKAKHFESGNKFDLFQDVLILEEIEKQIESSIEK